MYGDYARLIVLLCDVSLGFVKYLWFDDGLMVVLLFVCFVIIAFV